MPQHVFKGYIEDRDHDRQPERPEEARRNRAVRVPVGRRRGVRDRRVEEARRLVGGEALGLSVGPTYVVDIKNGTNAAALSTSSPGNIDLFNNFAPKSAIRGQFKTYFGQAPYHLGANTTWLFPNTTKKPLNDAQFRRALAYSINMGQITRQGLPGPRQQGEPDRPAPDLGQVGRPEGRRAATASRTTPTEAKAILAAAGYKDTNGDGYVENKDGSNIELKIVCPNGWSDWMTAIQVISDSAKAVGIKVTAGVPRVRDARRRPRSREVRPAARATTASTPTRRGRTTSTSTNCRSWTTRRR